MHISEGVLSPMVLGAGYALTIAGCWAGLRRTNYDRLVVTAMLSAVFFVASLVHVPLGPGNVHLILNGLLGLFLGWTIFPALLISLLLQAILFRYGGIACLGVNTFDMAFPAVICHYLFRSWLARGRYMRLAGSFLCGALSVAGAALCTALALALTDEGFLVSARILFVAHLPIMVLEGVIVAIIVSYIGKNRPNLLHFDAPDK